PGADTAQHNQNSHQDHMAEGHRVHFLLHCDSILSDIDLVKLTLCRPVLRMLHAPWKDERRAEHPDKAGCDRARRAGEPALKQGERVSG
ncbi:MAG: hypothetical protein IKP72_08395, partial [Clostridia bacterium]|nr:hypothetical protein [Clostridia bacterium]